MVNTKKIFGMLIIISMISCQKKPSVKQASSKSPQEVNVLEEVKKNRARCEEVGGTLKTFCETKAEGRYCVPPTATEVDALLEIAESLPPAPKGLAEYIRSFNEKESLTMEDIGTYVGALTGDCAPLSDLKIWRSLSNYAGEPKDAKQKISSRFRSRFVDTPRVRLNLVNTMVDLAVFKNAIKNEIIKVKPEGMNKLEALQKEAKLKSGELSDKFADALGTAKPEQISKNMKGEASLVEELSSKLDRWIASEVLR